MKEAEISLDEFAEWTTKIHSLKQDIPRSEVPDVLLDDFDAFMTNRTITQHDDGFSYYHYRDVAKWLSKIWRGAGTDYKIKWKLKK